MLRQGVGLGKEEGGSEGEGTEETGNSLTDSQASAPSEFDISSTEVEQALKTQGKPCPSVLSR